MNADRTDHNPRVCYQLLDTLQKAVTLYKRRNEPGIGLAEVVQIENDLDLAVRDARSFLRSFPELGADHLITPLDKREPWYDDCEEGNCWVSGRGGHMWEFTSPKSIRDWEGYVWLPHWAIPHPLHPLLPSDIHSENPSPEPLRDPEKPPHNCRQRLEQEGKPHPKSGCEACGETMVTGQWRLCDAALREELSPAVPAPMNPVLPTEELRQQWYDANPEPFTLESVNRLIDCASQWAADQELFECAEWLRKHRHGRGAEMLVEDRRPNLPTLKEQALKALEHIANSEYPGTLAYYEDYHAILRALNSLPDLEQ